MELNPVKKSILNIVKYTSCFSDKLCYKTESNFTEQL